MTEIDRIRGEEGFRAQPYHCPAGKLTIGYGLNLEAGITEPEARMLLQMRVTELRLQLKERIPFYATLPEDVRDVLAHMAYQMGIDGVLKFRNTLASMERGDWIGAADMMLMSRWADQTPERAWRLAERVRRVAQWSVSE